MVVVEEDSVTEGGKKERRRALVFGETGKAGTREESVDEERRTKDRVSSTAGAI